jgi:hypothetical protein
MPEHWEDELTKLDRLVPSDDVRGRIGHVSLRDVHHGSDHRVRTVAVVTAISLAAGVFAWRALSPIGQSETHQPMTAAELPDFVDVRCSASGTDVSTPTVVGARGIHFEVSNPGGIDEVIIAGTSGEVADDVADLDLSSSGLRHTFDTLPPGDYVVGCFSDEDVPRGVHETIVNAPGMQPIEILNPDGLYVSPTLDCEGTGAEEIGGVLLKEGATNQNSIRSGLDGLDASDVIEPSGYVALADGPERFGTYRVVRDGNVIANIRLLGVFNNDGASALSGDMKVCSDSGLRFDIPQ